MKFMAINAVTELEDRLFLKKKNKQRDRKIILENNLTSSDLPSLAKKNTLVIALIYFRM